MSKMKELIRHDMTIRDRILKLVDESIKDDPKKELLREDWKSHLNLAVGSISASTHLNVMHALTQLYEEGKRVNEEEGESEEYNKGYEFAFNYISNIFLTAFMSAYSSLLRESDTVEA